MPRTPGTQAYLDGRPASADDLRALALANYGHFTSMQMRGRAVRGLDLHLRRLQAGTRELFDCALDAGRVRRDVLAAADAEGVDDASVRITVYARDFQPRHPEKPVAVDVLVALAPPAPPEVAPARVKTYAFQRPLPHVKHVGTFPLFQWRRQARRDGFDDALFVDPDGRISEGSVWNVGFWDGEQVLWPQADALRGTAERLLQAGLADIGLPQRHVPVAARELAGLRAAFATNANGLWPLSAIDDTALPQDPELMERLDAALEANPWQPLAGEPGLDAGSARRGDVL